MSIAQLTNPSAFCSSSTLSRSLPPIKQNPCLPFLSMHLSSKNFSFPDSPVRFSGTHFAKPLISLVRASSAPASESQPSESDGEGEYEVELEKPYGLKFVKGRDGRTYIDAILPGGAADQSGKFSVGDKVIATRIHGTSISPTAPSAETSKSFKTDTEIFAVFGTEIWPAAEYGRTMYTIRQRIGPLLMKMQKRDGKLEDSGELSEKEVIRAERNSGVISNRVREIQMQNYLRKMEQKESREKDLREGLILYRGGKYEEALEKFESVMGSKPEPMEASVASYNIACCYSKLNQVQAGLSALEDALEAGYENFKTIRTDPDLANLRASEEFESLVKRFDESFINENAINAIKSLFGIFNKK